MSFVHACISRLCKLLPLHVTKIMMKFACQILLTICISTFVLSVMSTDNQEHIIVHTPLGPVKGIKGTNRQTGGVVYEFRGIPYAKPPMGSLRFSKPEPVESWRETLDGTTFGAGCPQSIPDFMPDWKPAKMSEDCLVLNVYIPEAIDQNNKLSVMVWIHGGGLQIGFAHQYDGGWIASEGGVIVVTINYRLNVFGFLSLGHHSIKGNFGLWDQQMALQWVHNNIAAFGGNPESVTIFGESAGGWSTSFQSLIPLNKGLIHRVISQSGVVDRINVMSKKIARKLVRNLADKTSCPLDNMNKLADCLRDKSMEELLNKTNMMDSARSDRVEWEGSVYFPTVDGDLFPSHPIKQVEDKTSDVAKFYKSLDHMAGTTSNEGSLLLMMMMAFPGIQEHFGFNLTDGIPAKFVCDGMIAPFVKTFYNDDPEIRKKICDFYTLKDAPLAEQGRRATAFIADIVNGFGYPTIRMLDIHSSMGGKTYQYQFSKTTDTYVLGLPPPEWFEGCGHGEEIMYMFDLQSMFPSANISDMSDEIRDFSRTVIQYWTSFAKYGEPFGRQGSVPWKPFDPIGRHYLDIDIPCTLRSNLNPEMVEFWTNQVPPIEIDPEEVTDHDEL